MRPVDMSRAEASALVQRIIDVDYVSDDEVDDWLDRLDRALGCPSGHVSGLIVWPPESPHPSVTTQRSMTITSARRRRRRQECEEEAARWEAC
ncbi:hypothetical protein [Streptomyces iakyrus]|uniref:hypothetical protein n=1 Tax=Streptomyces iakyrus TaxID=68219 RepID=UPI00383BD459